MYNLKSGRLGGRKSTTGCKTCKIRKIKCDEARPSCNRCKSTGRQCDGYEDYSRRYSPLTSQYITKTFTYGSDTEVRLFEYFIIRIIPSFTRNVEEEFWHVLVPQFSHFDQTIWHAVISMSILFQRAHLPDAVRSNDGGHDALAYYQKSLRQLQEQIEKSSHWTVTCEMTAIIYICIECLQQKPDEAKHIFLRATNVIQYDERTLLTGNACVRKAVGTLLRHMAISQGASIPLRSPSPTDPSNLLVVARDAFHDIVFEAHSFICQTQEHKISEAKDWIPSEALVKSQAYIRQKLQDWYAILPFDISLPSDVELHAVLMLVFHQYQIWLATCTSMYETAFDEFIEEFELMLQYAQIAISINQRQCVFSFETRVLPSIFFVAIKCREPYIRRRAISLLETGPKMENTHNATHMSKVAQRAVGIEEGGHPDAPFLSHCFSRIPTESCRIHRLLDTKLPDMDEQYLDIGGWRQQDGDWHKFDYLVKL